MSLVLKALLAGLALAGIVAVIGIFAAYSNQQTTSITGNDYGFVWMLAIPFVGGFVATLVVMSQRAQKIFQRLL